LIDRVGVSAGVAIDGDAGTDADAIDQEPAPESASFRTIVLIALPRSCCSSCSAATGPGRSGSRFVSGGRPPSPPSAGTGNHRKTFCHIDFTRPRR
ncbi:MAG TPA: hypothetical protein VKD71_04060, partial [Gemmataceae bacterium]|nr:hypothetical protein [Gemmataceae bacterium]